MSPDFLRPTRSFLRPREFGIAALAIVAVLLFCEPGAASAPEGGGLQVEPRAIRLHGGDASQQVSVTVSAGDGSTSDVTSECRYVVLPNDVAEVSPSGFVRPKADGRALLRISLGAAQAEVEVCVNEATARRPVSFRNDVATVFSKAGCNAGACHGNSGGKGGFRLSLRGDDPGFDYLSITREALGRRVSPGAPDRSLILLKPTGQVPHEGGQRFAPDSALARSLRDWIAAGVRDDLERAPRLKSIRVLPADRVSASPRRTAQLAVTAEFADGSTRDVTRLASFDVNDPTLAEVSPGGLVHAVRPSEVTVAVRYLSGRGVSRLAFLADRPGYAWTGPPAKNLVDAHVFAKLKMLKIDTAKMSIDSVFLRRAYLDAIGRLPTAAESRLFLADRNPGKRDTLINGLLGRPEFADYWALKWADLLRNEEKTMGSKGVWVFQRWLRDQIAAEVPLDQMVRQIVASRGSTYTNPPSSFHRTNRDPLTAAETVAQVFLGIRLQCAKCHNHPFDDWTQDDYYGLAACFSNVSRKELNNVRRDNFDKHEINGDEFVYLSGRPEMVQPRTRKMLAPTPLRGRSFSVEESTSALDQLADWLTRDNRQFARNLANRTWFHLMGRGIVEPVDDFRESNPPSNPALLESLTDFLKQQGMRLKPLVGLIMKSQAYQLDSVPNPTNEGDTANFARASVRLLPAEVLLDAISQVLDVADPFEAAPRRLRATQLPGVAAGNAFLKAFGKPERLLTCECERTESTTLAQAFQMINGAPVRRKLESSGNRIGKLLDQKATDETILAELFLAALCRNPTAPERQAIVSHVKTKSAADRSSAWEDVAWALINSKEFLLRH